APPPGWSCRRPGGDREAVQAPLQHPVGQAAGRPPAGGQQPDGVVGQHAVGAAAVGDDLGAVGQLGEPGLEFVQGKGDGPGDVPGGVFGGRADVDHGGGACPDPVQQLLAGELVGVVGAEVGGAGLPGGGLVVAGDLLQQRVQGSDVLPGQPIVDAGAVAAGVDQPRLPQGLQVR